MSETKFNKVKALRGMNDILPSQAWQWERLESVIHQWLSQYGYQNFRTPVLEQTRLFARGIGEVTDIVEKEMYTFSMKKENPKPEDMYTMRPEFTAGAVRAAIEHNLLYDRPYRLYTMGPVFRHERPQKGRYRQFHQLSVEAMGFEGADTDAELIIMLSRLWKQLGLTDIRLELNSLGQVEERLAHRDALIAYLESHQDILDEDAKRRLYTNPLRILDTKNPAMQEMVNNAPKLFDYLGEASLAHFEELTTRLKSAGVDYTINPRLVRGLDYYNLTVFEWVTDSLGAQATVCGGGRYDGLFELLGGKQAACVGFGMGLERLLLLIEQAGIWSEPAQCDVYFVHQGIPSSRQAMILAEQCRDAGYSVIVHPGAGSFKSQFKKADASGAKLVIILGESELEQGQVGIKFLRQTHEQLLVLQSDLVSTLNSIGA